MGSQKLATLAVALASAVIAFVAALNHTRAAAMDARSAAVPLILEPRPSARGHAPRSFDPMLRSEASDAADEEIGASAVTPGYLRKSGGTLSGLLRTSDSISIASGKFLCVDGTASSACGTNSAAISYTAAALTLHAASAGRIAIAHGNGAITLTPGTDVDLVAGRLMVRHATAGFSFGTAGTEYFGMAAGTAQVDLTAGTLNVSGGAAIEMGDVRTWSSTAPTLPVACATVPTITAGTATSFRADVGTDCTVQDTISFTLPATAVGWRCTGRNLSNDLADLKQQGAESTTGATLKNFTRTTGAPLVWTNGDDVRINCTGGP